MALRLSIPGVLTTGILAPILGRHRPGVGLHVAVDDPRPGVVEPGEVDLWVGTPVRREAEARVSLTGPVHRVTTASPG